jgi:hypothetical protein
MNPLIHLKRATSLFLIVLGFVWLGLLPTALAVSPAPDGGYPGGNTAEGQAALLSLTTGGFNTAVGFLSLRSDTTGQLNTAIGAGALLANISDENTATGAGALLSSTSGSDNTAVGAFALFSNTTGADNTAVGSEALLDNNVGIGNTAIGQGALKSNTTGVRNTAVGVLALVNSTGADNTAIGADALLLNSSGNSNTANGSDALRSNTDGYENTAIGYQALLHCTGAGNTALGYLAGQNLTTGDDNIDIGADGVAGDAGVIRIGRSFINATYIAGIVEKTAPGGIAVFINSDGELGTSTSSARFKDDIKPMDKASELVYALKPVTFRYKKELDRQGIQHWGLVAEDVQKVNPALVALDKEGRPYAVRYDQVNAMLLNEFLKEHKKTEKLEATVASPIATVKKQASQIQKVSAQLEASRSAPQVADSNY